MRLLTYILAILLFLPVKARGEAIDTPVEPLLLYKAKQDVRCQQWVDSIMNKATLKESRSVVYIYDCSGRYQAQPDTAEGCRRYL